jgi:penicillin-binding protein 2
VVDVVTGAQRVIGAQKVEPVPIQPDHMAVIRRALVGVTQEGTSASSFRGAPYLSAGKTGTAQVVGLKENEKYNASKMAEHLRDHALYVAYAPAETPTIALAMVVENAGFGAQSAAPIARRVFDYTLLGLVPSAEDIALTQQGKSAAPTGKQRPADQYPLPGVASTVPVGELRLAKETR